MATRTTVISDLSGEPVDDETHVSAVVQWPDLNFPVRLDLAASEADKLADSTLRMATFELHYPNQPVKTVRCETKMLDKLFSDVTWDDIIGGAPKAEMSRSTPAKRTAAKPSGDKVDWTSPENAGKLHRGRITDAEKDWVKANQKQASYNREQQTGKPIDFEDEAEKRRYGL